MSETVLVAGATGGVGQIVVAKLLQADYRVRVLTRYPDQAERLFEQRVDVAVGDIRQPETLPAATAGIQYLICATGTTAFPSQRWDFHWPTSQNWAQAVAAWVRLYRDREFRRQVARNGPDQVDGQGVTNLVIAAPRDLQRFVFVSSCGVERKTQFPFSVLNAFGVLDAKEQGEKAIHQSGLPYTIIRPARLIDGPFTSYDLNTLLKATTGGKLGVVIGRGDRLNGQTSRIDVANACVAALQHPGMANQTFEIINQGKRSEPLPWGSWFPG